MLKTYVSVTFQLHFVIVEKENLNNFKNIFLLKNWFLQVFTQQKITAFTFLSRAYTA